MIYKFETKDKEEALLLLRAADMSKVIFELRHNFWRKWKHSESDIPLEELKEAITDLLSSYNIENE